MIWMLLPFGKGLALPKLFGGREKKNLFYLEKAFCAVFFVPVLSKTTRRLVHLANCLI